ncbi:MAG TPA: L,D-transpeptidase family protein [Solirubrobacteraceae bacterium]|nr:L,D-transpeptidase family protein [Solirubrobacteraceae bacterium]
MAIGSARGGVVPIEHGWKHALLSVVAGVAVIVVLVALAALLLSGTTLASDSTALAHVSVQPLGGKIEHIEAYGPGGRRIPIAVHDGMLTPLHKLTPGERVSVAVAVRRPGWIGWALGSEHTVRLTMRTPVAHVTQRWLTVPSGSQVKVGFDEPVSAVTYYGGPGGLTHRVLAAGQRSVSLGHQAETGATEIAAAARPWESVGAPMQVSWFPPSSSPVLATIPAAGDSVSPTAPIYLTFSKPVSEALGSGHPRISPNVPGKWREANSHTLVFTPHGFGAPLGSQLRVQLPNSVAVTGGAGGGLRTTSQVEWAVPQGSTLRLQQLLAETGYLPVVWHPSGAPVPATPSAQAQAAVDPPSGSFSWRYPNTPQQLQALWAPGQWSEIVKGAVMKFENNNNLEVDGEAGPQVWKALLQYVLAGKRLSEPYSYVYVHREVPETMTLWSAGHIVETSAANTGIAGAETELGTFAVFEHIPEGTMSGTNPDGSHYEDPGIKWISYFNGGDALHYFDRASFGFQQSLGCVELPLEAAAEEWPYTTIGTLVTIEA